MSEKTIFDTNETNEQDSSESFIEQIVGQDKKFKDIEALAKGKIESDRYIKDLENQLQEMRSDLDKEGKIDELMALVRSQRNQSANSSGEESGTEETGSPGNTSTDMTEERLMELIETKVSEREKSSRQQKNLTEVTSALKKSLGDKANTFVTERANELGMSLKEIENLAKENPKALFQLLGLNNKTSEKAYFVGGGRSSETSSTTSNGETRNFQYYQELRRKNKKAYYEPSVQRQMLKDREALGNAFYN